MNLFSSSTTESVFRKICYLIAALSLTLGLYVYAILDFEPIKYIEIGIGIFFLLMPVFTRWIGLYLNISIFFIVLNAALCFYGILLGPLSEIHILVAFLLGASTFLLRGKKLMIFPVTLVTVMLVFLELNYYNRWFTPLEIDYRNAMKVRWVVVFTGSSLSAVTVFYFAINWVNERTRRINQQLQEAVKVNMYKTKFLSETSHELRTPLSNILGIAEFLNLRKYDYTPEVRVEIDSLLQSAYLAGQIVNNHLDLARIEAGKFTELNPETVDLKFVADTCMAMQRVIANTRNIKLEIEIDSALPQFIKVDKVALYTIINNLSSNVVKHTPENKTAQIRIYREGERMIIETKNAGHIDQDILQTIFKPFVASNTQNSTGLGLPIIKHIAQLLKGDVYVYTLMEFVVFKFEMPLIAAKEPITRQVTNKIKGALRGYKIMIIDDNDIFRRNIERNVLHTGAQCITMESAVNALQAIGTELPNLIICDMKLPGLSGPDFAQKLKQQPGLAHIPIIFLSADAFETSANIRQTTAGDEFLCKPYLSEDLYALLTKYLTPIRLIVRDSA
ncbi:hybrid sensor histidine kinase/response regulator [Chitinophaga qingshengii]|uniref:histidine kinase n=1 Tax=Chitinophaga qingshengii TaxID=1569794 RepID=A0ABR7TVT6_9BACT|nr:response regulator [Chitinophaga qingshengii]MBC9933521.1 response regulator [Chitinophaga qingshengii]